MSAWGVGTRQVVPVFLCMYLCVPLCSWGVGRWCRCVCVCVSLPVSVCAYTGQRLRGRQVVRVCLCMYSSVFALVCVRTQGSAWGVGRWCGGCCSTNHTYPKPLTRLPASTCYLSELEFWQSLKIYSLFVRLNSSHLCCKWCHSDFNLSRIINHH